MLVKYNKPNALGIGDNQGGIFMLKPGVNEVPDSIYEDMKKNPSLQFKFDRKELEIVVAAPEAGESATSGPIQNLSEMSEKDALEVVKDTLDDELLLSWSIQEKRPKVRKAIDKQLKLIEVVPDDKE